MKKLLTLTLIVVAATAAAATPSRSSSNTPGAQATGTQTKERTVVGYIADGHCGKDHHKMKWNLAAKECALECARQGRKLALVVGRVVYILNDEAQEQAREFAGQKVRVTGLVNSKVKTIRVTKMEAVS
jgi:hypothetical protein